jgi:hypothetical protein
MEQQNEGPDRPGDVRFEKVTVGDGCVFINVSTIGKAVTGTEINIENHTLFYGGQMSDESLQSLPRLEGASMQDSAAGGQSTDAGVARRHGIGYTLGQGGSTSTGAKRSL